MRTTNEALKIVSLGDTALHNHSLLNVAGLNPGEELDPNALQALLGDIDGLKRAIQERMRRIEASKEAERWLVEDTLRTESLNKQLTDSQLRDRVSGEAATIAWPRLEEAQDLGPNFVGAPTPVSGATLEEWNELRKQGKLEIDEAKALLANAQANYVEAAEKEAKCVADLQSANQRLEVAEQLYKEINRHNLESKKRADEVALSLEEAKVREETAAAELYTARQELTTAYQFASVAAQRRLESAEFFDRTARWALFAVVSSWIATVWMGWIALVAFQKHTTIILPILGSIILILTGKVLVKRRVRASEDS